MTGRHEFVEVLEAEPLHPEDAGAFPADGQTRRVEVTSGADLLSMDYKPPEPIMEPMLYPGCTVLSAKPKAGKSWLALQWALCIVANRDFPEGGTVRRGGDVIYCGLEEPKSRTADRMRRLLKMGDADFLDRLHFIHRLPTIAEGGIAELDRLAAQIGPTLIVVDTFRAVCGGTDNQAKNDLVGHDYQRMNLFREIGMQHSCAVLVVHHNRKMGGDGIDSAAGTHGITAAADCVMSLSKKPGGKATLSVTGREVAETTLALSWSDDPNDFAWHLEGEAAELSEARNDVLIVLDGEGLQSIDSIARKIRRTHAATKQLLRRMYQDGLLVNAQGKYAIASGAVTR